jgi:preprotein translocase subunit SecG
MLHALQVFLALVVLVLLTPQTRTVNYVLRKFYESGVFATYSEAVWFVKRLTWVIFFAFFVVTYLAARA